MICIEMRAFLLDYLDGTLAVAEPATQELCRTHLEACEDCTREVERHRRSWRLLGELRTEEVAPERLAAMADAVLARADLPSELDDGSGAAAAEIRRVPRLDARRRISRRLVPMATAAALLVMSLFAVRALLLHSGGSPGAGPKSDEAPDFLDDPEFVKNFDVIRDLPDLDAQGELLDMDADDLVLLQLLEGV